MTDAIESSLLDACANCGCTAVEHFLKAQGKLPDGADKLIPLKRFTLKDCPRFDDDPASLIDLR